MTCLVPVRNGPEIPNPTQKQNAYINFGNLQITNKNNVMFKGKTCNIYT